MPSPFEGIEGRIFAATSTVWGEQFQHRPMCTRPNKGPIPDPDRAGCCFTGQLRRKHSTESLGSYGARDGRAAISTKEPRLEVMLADFASEPRQGDIIERLDPPATYEISDIRPNGYGRAELTLLETAAPRQAP
jgi:hypothetical protein